ncbi:hypothetical protein ACET3Z_020625 [Daucus carota]
MIFRFLILFFVVSATSKTTLLAFSNNDTDLLALRAFNASIEHDPLGALASWNNSIHFCQWNGVKCSSQRVTELDLSSKQLVGTLSSHIGNLSFLRVLSLYENNFHGLIPNEIGRLSRLQIFSLASNSFEGELPTNLSRCVDITLIALRNNHLQGEVFSEFASWPKLNFFTLAGNSFTGSIPPSIGNISSLSVLDLSENNLHGHIPLEVAHHKNLERLVFANNSLSGIIPLQIYNISSLSVVDLSRNNLLEGTLPADFGFTLPQLTSFIAGGNRISGPLPPSLANASNLVTFDIIENSITGPIPNNLGSLSQLECLNIGDNPLGDGTWRDDDLSFLDSLVNCTKLSRLNFASSGLKGKLPDSIVNLSAVEQMYLSENHIYGSIPREIGKLVNVSTLSFHHNLLTGSIPESIGKLSKLGELDLAENNLSGSIPTSISNITQLVRLRLKGNMLNGSIPAELFNISTLERLSLADNRLAGEIPKEIVFLSHCNSLNLSQNLLSGALPSNIGGLKQLVKLDVSNNKLSGDIPASLGRCVMLVTLYMEGNSFQGKIPSAFKELKSLEFLDISNNNISGDIPSFFDEFRLINFLNLSHNKLEGEVSKTGLFSNISAFSVAGNSRLCGGIAKLHLHDCPNKNKTISMRLVLVLVFVPLGILLASLALICYRRRNSRNLDDPVPNPILEDNSYLRISYKDLFLATKEFSPKNLLGEGRYGSVYKGVLKSMEHVVTENLVAVKVLKVEVTGASKSFLAECEALRNIRHRNLIKIITTCSSTDFEGNDFKALVFEFMSKGSVENWLHPSPSHQGNKENLSLLQRLNISIDVAMGLDYLHHHSSPTIVHSDIKPSNILLDEDFVAHIGDFGLARFSFSTSDVNQAQMSSTSIHGTIGYVPPEYGMGGEISTEGDVYSYGIFLLEFFSGKRPTECSDGSNLHEYVRNALPYKVIDITDPRILLDQEEHGLAANNRASMEVCLGSIYEVGILCSQEMPQNRIDIGVAIKQLHVAREKLLQLIQ